MLILRLPKQYTLQWLSLQFKNWKAMVIFKGYEFKDTNIRDVVALNLGGSIRCIGNLQNFYRIRNSQYYRVFVEFLMSFYPIEYPMKKDYEIAGIIINRKESWIKIGDVERKIRRFHTRFAFRVS